MPQMDTHLAVMAVVDALVAIADDSDSTYGPEDIAEMYRARREVRRAALPEALR